MSAVADDAGRTRREAERLEEEVNRLALVSRWADDLAHEIKNPFHAMVINLELVKRRAGDPDGLRERAEVVESELHRVHALVDSVLKLVRPWPDAETADTDGVFDTLLPALRARASLRKVDYTHEPGGAAVAMPPGELALVILNLVDNALDALPEGGRLITRCQAREAEVRIEVGDDGPGLPDLDADPFQSGATHREGRAGLGLAVARRMVRRAGGTVDIGPGQGGAGTTIALTLPRPGAADRPA